jgi:hypothetical protein
VLRIKSDSTARYWRATVLNAVIGGKWSEDYSPDPVQHAPFGEPGLIPKRQLDDKFWVPQTVKVEALKDKHLVAASTPARYFASSVGQVGYDATGIAETEHPLHRGETYEVVSYSPSPTPEQLARSKPVYPALIRDGKYREVEHHVYPELFGAPNRKRNLDFLFSKSVYAEAAAVPAVVRPGRARRQRGQSPYAAAVARALVPRRRRFLRPAPAHTPGVRRWSTSSPHPSATATLRGRDGPDASATSGSPRGRGGFTSGRTTEQLGVGRLRRDAHAWWRSGSAAGAGFRSTDARARRPERPYSSSSTAFDVAATAAVLRGARESGSSAASPISWVSAARGGSRPRSPTWRRRLPPLRIAARARGACFASSSPSWPG